MTPPPGSARERRREAGVVLLLVLFFALLLAGSIATFTARATVDSMISRNREAAARAEALARGGVRLATALLLEDAGTAREGTGQEAALDSYVDVWARLRDFPIESEDGGTLRIGVEDSGTRLNLNAVVTVDAEGNLAAPEETEQLLHVLLETAIGELDLPPEEKDYEIPELVDNLIDFVDRDDVSLAGGLESEVYVDRVPPFTPPNRPLMSIDELRRVAGFDSRLVDALRPYVTIYPYAGGGGINPNTAPPHVLSLIFYNDGVSLRLATEDVIRKILEAREEGKLLCGEEAKFDGCLPIREIVPNAIYPAPTYTSNVFTVTAEARVGTLRRRVEAVIDRSEPGTPLLLSWRVR